MPSPTKSVTCPRADHPQGQLREGESFKDSLVDGEHQKELHDRERRVHSEERFDELRAAAEADWRKTPMCPASSSRSWICSAAEDPKYELEAIQLLDDEHARNQDYRFKLRADDIRMKQLHRAERKAGRPATPEALRQARIKTLGFEIRCSRNGRSDTRRTCASSTSTGAAVQRSEVRRSDPDVPGRAADPRAKYAARCTSGGRFSQKLYAQPSPSYGKARACPRFLDDESGQGDDVLAGPGVGGRRGERGRPKGVWKTAATGLQLPGRAR